MIFQKSVQMMGRSFEKTRYQFQELPQKISGDRFGIYVNVPFCKTKCAFCPFYKELFDEQLKDAYLEAITREIGMAEMSGAPNWIYFGGGTPNLLTIEELGRIISHLRAKVSTGNMGIELLPRLVTPEYLMGLKKIGFTKVSLGVESLSEKVTRANGRENGPREAIGTLIVQALEMGFWVNTDLIIGLKSQDETSFLEDIRLLAEYTPSQITTYPYMAIRGTENRSSMSDPEKYRIIELAGAYLAGQGYSRNSIWCFTRGNDVYDSSQDELIDDYMGFGPAAFSTFGPYKAVNPDVRSYLQNYRNGSKLGFVSLKTEDTDQWRKFARMIYTLKCETSSNLPWYINSYCRLLQVNGIRKNGTLSEKGLMFAHDVTKKVVESLPFPIQNKACVGNWEKYEGFLESLPG